LAGQAPHFMPALDRYHRAYYRWRTHLRELMAHSAATPGFDPLSEWRVAPKWQIGLCLLLAALIIYNPFLAGAGSGAGLCVEHSASNRATVGASELQQFSPINGQKTLAIAAVSLLQQFDRLLSIASEPHEGPVKEVLPAVQYLPASLWFRPPPGH
jgi:hypothetical protein